MERRLLLWLALLWLALLRLVLLRLVLLRLAPGDGRRGSHVPSAPVPSPNATKGGGHCNSRGGGAGGESERHRRRGKSKHSGVDVVRREGQRLWMWQVWGLGAGMMRRAEGGGGFRKVGAAWQTRGGGESWTSHLQILEDKGTIWTGATFASIFSMTSDRLGRLHSFPLLALSTPHVSLSPATISAVLSPLVP